MVDYLESFESMPDDIKDLVYSKIIYPQPKELLQEIRDDSHRFAINAQRKQKNAKIRKSKLDNIEGIGEVLKKRLLLNFKSLKNIKSANIEDLMTVKGINAKIAKLIKEKL